MAVVDVDDGRLRILIAIYIWGGMTVVKLSLHLSFTPGELLRGCSGQFSCILHHRDVRTKQTVRLKLLL